MGLKLYEYDDAMYLDCVDEETGEIDMEKLEALQAEKNEKISNIACWIKDLKAEGEAIKKEKMALAERQRIAENKVESLKNYLQMCLNGEKFKDARVSISYRTSTSTEIDESLDLSILPDSLKKITVEPNKTAIKEAIEAGLDIEGCHLVTKTNIQIR